MNSADESYKPDYTGFYPLLQNGDIGSILKLERTYDRKKVAEGIFPVEMDKVVTKESAVIKNQDGERLDEPPKIIYCDPSEVPLPDGYRSPADYTSSGYGRSGHITVEGGAVLAVESDIPVENNRKLQKVSNLLIGDTEDQKVEGDEVIVNILERGI